MPMPPARHLTKLVFVGLLASGALGDPLLRLLVDGKDATFWTVHHTFTLQARGTALQGGAAFVVEGPACGSPSGHAAALEGALAAGGAPEVEALAGGGAAWSWRGLRAVRGGAYAACWCGGGGCQATARFRVLGPRELLDEHGQPLALGATYVREAFSLRVEGIQLAPSAQLRLVGSAVRCGTQGAAAHTEALAGALADLPGTPLVTGAPSSRYSSLVWPASYLRRSGSFHVCWCSGVRSSDAGQHHVDLSLSAPGATGDSDGREIVGDNFSMNWTSNSTNGSNESENASTEAAIQSSASQRLLQSVPIADHDDALNDTQNLTSDHSVSNHSANESHEVAANICTGYEMFDVDIGSFSVAGPTGLTVQEMDGRYPRVGRNFTLVVHGLALGNGSQRVRVVSDSVRCGEVGAANNTEHLLGILAEDPDARGSGPDLSVAQSWTPLRFVHEGQYTVCWCSGRGGSCENDQDFDIEVHHISIVFPRLKLHDESGDPLRALVNVTFKLQLAGTGLSPADGVRIVEMETQCGTASAGVNTAALRGHLGVPEVNGGGTLLGWPGLRLMSGGMRRVCWCPRGSQTGVQTRGCTSGSDFYVEVGVFGTLLVRHAWVDSCVRARRPFRIHVAAIGLRPEVDRVLLARASDVCGEALSNDGILSPGTLVEHTHLQFDTGFAALRCAQDPLAGAVLGERKLVCGGQAGTVQVASPGVYRICLCGATAHYDCSDPAHYWVPAGAPFEVAPPATSGPGREERAQEGGAAPPPLVLNGPSPVLALSYAPPGNASAEGLLAAASEDGAVRLWEPGAPRMVAELVGHVGRVAALAWAPDGSWLASGGVDGTLRLWSAASGIGPGAAQAHVCPRWEPAWNRPSGNASDEWWQDVIFGHILDLLPANVSEEPRTYRYAQQREDVLPIDDLHDLSVLNELTLKRAARQCAKACVAYRELASGMCECGPRLECHLLNTCVPKCGLEDHVWKPAHELGVAAIAVSANGELIATASTDTTIKIWDVQTRTSVPLAVLRLHARGVRALAFSPSIGSMGGMVLASGGDDRAVMWHNITSYLAGANVTGSLWQVQDAVGPGLAVLAVAFSADGRWFAAAGSEGGAIWDASTRTKVRDLAPLLPGEDSVIGPLPAVAGLAFAADGAWLALRGPLSVQLWPLAEIAGHQQAVSQEWVSFTTSSLGSAFLHWTLLPGSAQNTPRYDLIRAANGSVLEVLFTPCDVSDGCSEHLPVVQLNVEVPFEFTAVRGSFVEFSPSPNGADDCRGGARHSSWHDENASRSYWTHIGPGQSAEDLDCERLGPKGDAGRSSLHACQQECLKTSLCNLVNYRRHPQVCELRRCLDARLATLHPKRDSDAWALVRRSDMDELVLPPHDGYVMFGAPNSTGQGGVAYGGCGAGPNLTATGTLIVVPETPVPRTRTLRWQVSQSRRSETLGLREVSLELLRPRAGRRFVAAAAAAGAAALAPARRELAAAVGEGGQLALWDLGGFDIPAERGVQRKLRSMFNFSLSAGALQDRDRVRIVSAEAVPACGNPHSSTSTKAIQGLGEGRRTYGNETYSLWDGVAVLEAGEYRICFCSGRPGICCDADADFSTELQTFVAPGAARNHYVVCEGVAAPSIRPECKIENFKGVGLQAGDMIMLQAVANCGEATGPLPGFPNGGVVVSRATLPRDFAGEQAAGSWYRFESATGGANSVLDPVSVSPPLGLTARLCWCGRLERCDPGRPSDFRIDAGLLTVVRVGASVAAVCYVKAACEVRLALADATPLAAGDLVMVKTGPAPSQRLGCPGDAVAGLGPAGDGRSGRMSAAQGQGAFGLGFTRAEPGDYRVCWCQGSIRPCVLAEDFSFDLGGITVAEAKYVWPACTRNETAFVGWRAWETFDDCCCNHAEAGALGCHDERTLTFQKCSALPPR